MYDEKEYRRQWRKENANRCAAYTKKYRLANKEKCRVANLVCKAKKPELYREINLRYEKLNLERRRELYRKWYRKNDVKVKTKEHARRSATKISEEVKQKIASLHKEQFCRWCARELETLVRHIDHIVPLSRGGLHTAENLCAACSTCNLSKKDRLVSEWLPLQNFATHHK